MHDINILLVEDDESLGYVIKDNLELREYEVQWCKDGQDGINTYQSGIYDLCILDVMLPKKDGFELAENIRSRDKNIPILFLTAKSMQQDKLEGFRRGGDDYITKPFSMDELVYRMEVFLKRRTTDKHRGTYQLGGYFFDYNGLKLSMDSDERVLTQKEADVLKYFADNLGQVVKRKSILKSIWGENDYFMGRSLDVFISKLRKYLKAEPRLEIINIHGVGFKLNLRD
ncbi:response regulator transcription factor [Fulvivirga sp. M361]|uniref:response regulator transcription factor n=1 Tax=Fulvivirga sp. M361 TaxID=2594266 RepID=UPI0011799BB7|nr:response regulator transcription factor [Fulvivirga sp. M361]TRX58698.1 response regulator transcription factor [Fulvivirga sp. M361]